MDSNKIKRGLGRGLSSLIGETKIERQKKQPKYSIFYNNQKIKNIGLATNAKDANSHK